MRNDRLLLHCGAKMHTVYFHFAKALSILILFWQADTYMNLHQNSNRIAHLF